MGLCGILIVLYSPAIFLVYNNGCTSLENKSFFFGGHTLATCSVCIYIYIWLYVWIFICICVYMICVHQCTCIGCYMIHTTHMNIWTYPVIQETNTGGFSPYFPGPNIPVAGQSTRKLTYSRRHHVSWCQEHPMPCYWWVINELTPKHLCYDWKLKKKQVFISPVNKSTFLNM